MGATSQTGELCVVASAGSLSLRPCLDAIALSTGDEIFQSSDDGFLLSSTGGDACVNLANGDASGGGKFIVESCREAVSAEDGRAGFQMSAGGQLQLALGNMCMVARNASTVGAMDCAEAMRTSDVGDKFFMVAMPELDPAFAEGARASAQMATTSAKRLAGLVAQLNSSLPRFEQCTLARRGPCTGTKCATEKYKKNSLGQANEASHSQAVGRGESVLESIIASMSRQLQIDGLGEVISDARTVITAAKKLV